MTNQLQGEILYEGWSGSGDNDWATTPWMPARADFATFAVEVTSDNSLTLYWEVQTRSLADPAAGSSIVGSPSIAGPGVSTAVNTTAAKQLVRYRFKTSGTFSTTNYIVFRALQPSWQGDR